MAELLKEHVVRMITLIMSGKGWSATRLAKEAGVSPSTITRALDPKNPFMPSGTTISKLVPILADDTIRMKDDLLSKEGEIASLFTEDLKAKTGHIPVIGTVQAGVWTDSAFQLTFEATRNVAIIDQRWADRNVFAFQVAGQNTDREFKDGSILLLEDWPENDVRIGDIVVMRRAVDFLGSRKFEISLWDIGYSGGDMQLSSRSIGPSEKFVLDEKAYRTRTEPVGIVVAAYHPINRSHLPLVPPP